ncbi:MAG: hypothetical protein US67_C0035G0006 [Candidatus Woesebacteria bacterium GW2011_GWD1_38_10]|uniref:Uncharacterized protein n=1 Tax=Candidatus Woesebacteria bacterium GW2011_GWD1_38_10 TaxID=1618592 RepID=A0A0G0L6S4_9BACT|nr:MAG: hypothetical protein US67_C0035G0006 [Candidatus Woesebacteria bacterium GW2011_GWD1_38_10]
MERGTVILFDLDVQAQMGESVIGIWHFLFVRKMSNIRIWVYCTGYMDQAGQI